MKTRVLVIALLATACSPPSSGATAGNGEMRGSALVWSAAAEDSVVQTTESSLERCWKLPSGFDCLRVGGGDVPGHGKLFTAVRVTVAHLPKDEWAYSEQYPEFGYVCQVMTERGLAVEAVQLGTPEKIENVVSLVGEEPIGHPLNREVVENRIRHLTKSKSRYFDCVELGGVLLAKGMSAVGTPDVSQRSLNGS